MSFGNIIDRPKADALIPAEGAAQIVKATAQASAALTLCRHATMSAKVYTQPVLSALPDAYWVSEGGLKQTSAAAWDGVDLVAEEIAVIVPVDDATLADASFNIWQELREPLGERFAQKIDQAVFGGVDKPATWPEAIIPGAIAAGNVQAAGASVAEGGIVGDLEATLSLVEDNGYDPTGYAGARTLKRRLRQARTAGGEALGEGSTTSQWDLPIEYAVSGSIPAPTLAIAGDWTGAILAIRQDLTMSMFTEGVISDEAGKVIRNLMQSDASALRCTMRVAFAVANPVNLERDDGYAFAVLQDSAPDPGAATTESRRTRKE